MTQFNRETSARAHFSITFQSNHDLNSKLIDPIKVEIAKRLINAPIVIHEIHSYVRANIMFSIRSFTLPDEVLRIVIAELSKPFAPHTEKLLFSVNWIHTNGYSDVQLQIDGDSDLDENFLKAIEDFHTNP